MSVVTMATSLDPGEDFQASPRGSTSQAAAGSVMSGGEGSKQAGNKFHSPKTPTSPKLQGDLPQNRAKTLRDLQRRATENQLDLGACQKPLQTHPEV